jgi:hypothetical protein
MEMASTLLGKLFTPHPAAALPWAPGLGLLLVLAGGWAMLGPNAFDMHARWRYRPTYALGWAAAFGICIALMAGGGSSPFLYFQF